MNHFTIPITCSILLLTLSACINETDTTQQPNVSTEQPGHTSEASSSEIQLPFTSSNEESGDSLDQNEPFVLDDFRNAIDSIVQDSIQEEVEKAVEDEMSKNTNNQK
jgi:hypothetical protein